MLFYRLTNASHNRTHRVVSRKNQLPVCFEEKVSFIALLLISTGCWELPSFGAAGDLDNTAADDSSDDDDTNDEACADNLCLISGVITEDAHWIASNRYVLRGLVAVGDGESETRLIIDPGTRISGERDTTGMLVVQRGSKIYAEGTADAPIVFSTDQSGDDKRRGDWGGLVINGNAPINGCEDETPCEKYGEGGTGWYGGDNAADSSGVLKYVRVEYAGKQLGPSIDQGGLSLRGVGSGTELSYLHLNRNQYDGINIVGEFQEEALSSAPSFLTVSRSAWPKTQRNSEKGL